MLDGSVHGQWPTDVTSIVRQCIMAEVSSRSHSFHGGQIKQKTEEGPGS